MSDVGGLGHYLNQLSPEKKAIRIVAFFQILKGNKPTFNELANLTGVPQDQILHYINEMIQQGLLVIDENETVVGSHGLSLIPTEHSLKFIDQGLFTWCAADAVGIPAALGVNAKITSRCFQCNESIEIVMNYGEIESSNKEDTRIWVAHADLGRSIVGCA